MPPVWPYMGAKRRKEAAMRACLVILALLLPFAAQADSIEQIDTPSGVTVDYVKCKRSPNKCMNAAAEWWAILGSNQ